MRGGSFMLKNMIASAVGFGTIRGQKKRRKLPNGYVPKGTKESVRLAERRVEILKKQAENARRYFAEAKRIDREQGLWPVRW